MTSLAPPRLIITTNTPTGTSIIARDDKITPFLPFGPTGSAFTIFHMTQSLPANPLAPLAPTNTTILPRPLPSGVVFGTTDIQPGGRAPMHRTVSIDYVFIISGSIWMVLDGGEETELKAGDFCLQRSANHSWVNKGDVTCRMGFVLIGSQKVVLEDGTALEESFVGKPPGAGPAAPAKAN